MEGDVTILRLLFAFLKVGERYRDLSTFKNGERFALHFRKGTIIVRLSSNSFRLVKKFAHCVAAQIEPT